MSQRQARVINPTYYLFMNSVRNSKLDINSKDKDGQTALMIATMYNYVDTLKKLLKNGADINAKNNVGMSALMIATKENDYNIVYLLLKNGADINAKDNDGKTAIMFATEKRYIPILKLLLKNGADINAKDNDGKTALMIACENPNKIDSTGLVDILLEAGADVRSVDNNGITPLMYALKIGPMPARPENEDEDEYQNNYEESLSGIVDKLLDAGANVNAADNDGKNPLKYALAINRNISEDALVGIVETLLFNGANRDSIGVRTDYPQDIYDSLVRMLFPVGVQPQMPINNLPTGVAFEVHKFFNDFEFDAFMEIIRSELGRRGISLSTSGDELLEPVIKYAMDKLPEKVDELNRINTRIKTYSAKNKRAVQDTIKYILAQPEDFINQYINNFIIDCLKAYNRGHSESCIAGQYERVFLSLHHVFFTKCTDTDEKVCPPDYRELLPLFPPDYDGIFKEWYDKEDPDKDGFVQMTKEEKKEYFIKKKAEFRKFIVKTIEMDKPGIDKYLNKIVDGIPIFEGFYFSMYGEGKRKKNKTKKGILRRIHTKKHNKKSTNKKSTNKKSTNKKSTNKKSKRK
jgi:hypothetical protein